MFQQHSAGAVFFTYLFIEKRSTVDSYISEQNVVIKSDKIISQVTSGASWFVLNTPQG